MCLFLREKNKSSPALVCALEPSFPSNAQHHFTGLLVKDVILILMRRSVKSTTQASSNSLSSIYPESKAEEDQHPRKQSTHVDISNLPIENSSAKKKKKAG